MKIVLNVENKIKWLKFKLQKRSPVIMASQSRLEFVRRPMKRKAGIKKEKHRQSNVRPFKASELITYIRFPNIIDVSKSKRIQFEAFGATKHTKVTTFELGAYFHQYADFRVDKGARLRIHVSEMECCDQPLVARGKGLAITFECIGKTDKLVNVLIRAGKYADQHSLIFNTKSAGRKLNFIDNWLVSRYDHDELHVYAQEVDKSTHLPKRTHLLEDPFERKCMLYCILHNVECCIGRCVHSQTFSQIRRSLHHCGT